MNKISVIITTHKAPEYLDLCLKSCLEGQTLKNEIVVVVDGTYDLNKSVLEKYKSYIKPVIFEENMGFCTALNYGVYAASNHLILPVNDDNVFPIGFDSILLKDYFVGAVLTPNQIEPYNSMFRQFVIHDFGRNLTDFNLKNFQQEEPKFRQNRISNEGSTFPFLMSKVDYLRIGGFDTGFNSAHVVDWEFFMKCHLAELDMARSYKCNFYHFVSTTLKSPEQIKDSQAKEQLAFEHFQFKWGTNIKHDPETNLKSI